MIQHMISCCSRLSKDNHLYLMSWCLNNKTSCRKHSTITIPIYLDLNTRKGGDCTDSSEKNKARELVIKDKKKKIPVYHTLARVQKQQCDQHYKKKYMWNLKALYLFIFQDEIWSSMRKYVWENWVETRGNQGSLAGEWIQTHKGPLCDFMFPTQL